MKLLIDQGNTKTKLAVFKNEKMIDFLITGNLSEEEFYHFIENKKILKSIYASVAEMPVFLAEYCAKFAINIKSLVQKNSDNQNKLENIYGFYDALGSDLLAIAICANHLCKNKPTLNISMGSCITYEIIEASGEFIGVAISPGIMMRAKSLNSFTNSLPLIDINKELQNNSLSTLEFATNTTNAILKGVISGIEGELQKNIHDFKTKYPTGKIFITGGDAHYFSSIPKTNVVDNMVLQGLNLIGN